MSITIGNLHAYAFCIETVALIQQTQCGRENSADETREVWEWDCVKVRVNNTNNLTVGVRLTCEY